MWPEVHHYCFVSILILELPYMALRKGSTWDPSSWALRQFSSVQSLIRVQLFATPWTAAHQASLSVTNSWSLPRLSSIKLVMPFNHLMLCRPLLLLPSIFPSIGSFHMSQLFTSDGQSIGVSPSTSVLPMNTQN